MKTCTKCRETKPLEQYSRSLGAKASKSGYKPRCKSCLAAEAKDWATRNADRVKRTQDEYRAANPEYIKARRAAHYAANAEREKALSRLWHEANAEKAAAISRDWRRANYGKVLAYARTRRARHRGAEGSHTAEDIAALFAKQRGTCAVCKCKLTKYHIDHVIPLVLGGSNYITNIQLLCPTCNTSKGAKHPIQFMQERGYLL
jgi:5-methylcytosine-specific restriction endonuclease McrA